MKYYKEAKRELKVKYNNETLAFCSEPKYLGVTFYFNEHVDTQKCFMR